MHTGFLDGERVGVCSTGIGGPSAAIAMEELYACGVRCFVRVGTCGGIQVPVRAGDLVIATAAVRQEGTSHEYAPPAYPAAASFDVTAALCAAARALSLPHHVGVVQSKDSFYGQHEPGRMPVAQQLMSQWEAWKRLGVLGSEMEAAALFCVCAALPGARCGCVLQAIWNQEREAAGLHEPPVTDTGRAVRCGVEALRRLIAADREGKPSYDPGGRPPASI